MENTIILHQPLLNCSTELEEAILLTAATLQPEKIFLMEHQGDGNQRHLVVIISEYEQRTIAGIIQSQDLDHLKQLNITYSLIRSSLYEAQFKISPIYFTVTCNEETLAYDDGYFAILEGNEHKLIEDREQAMISFYNGLQKVNTLLAGAKVFKENNLTKAAYHLYLATVTCLQTLLESIMGEITVTLDLEELFEMVSCCSNGLQETLNDGSVEDKRLFKILSDANKTYNSRTSFSAADIVQLIDKITQLQEVAENTFKDWLGRYEFHFLKRR